MLSLLSLIIIFIKPINFIAKNISTTAAAVVTDTNVSYPLLFAEKSVMSEKGAKG